MPNTLMPAFIFAWLLASQAMADPAPTPEPAATKAPWTVGYKDGFTVQSESGDFKLTIGGYAQADGRFVLDDEAEAVTDSFLIRRARTIFSGTLARHFDFTITPDFGGGSAALQDAYGDVRFGRKW